MRRRLNLAVLLSGSGTTLANLLDWIRQDHLLADIKLVVSSRPGAGGLQIAKDAGIPTEVVNARTYTRSGREAEVIRDWARMSRELDCLLLRGGYDLVCMAGFLSRYIFSRELEGKVLNIHPSLIPMFCGEGMYGHRVHEEVVASGVRVTGCTVHFADHSYDTGPIILQRCCPVFSDDGPDDVAARVFREECMAYPTAINLIAEGRIAYLSPRRIYVDGDRFIERFSYDDD
ncbi:MAG: phosphoribosylglycinamide formyltransferase [Planctomycetes bacterium]|nr:phosphoribosylglycinamide formyltransferase [Planctomycetota bacterium]